MAKQITNKNSKFEKWTTEQIVSLIDAYKEETCLYATNQVNYHNKHLRGEALVRVCEAVRKLRPLTNQKECMNKFHNLRNQFNIEHTKVRTSYKRGTGTDNKNKPSLWYYPELLFLDTYVTPRKSRNSLDRTDENMASPQFAASSMMDVNSHNQIREGTDCTNMLIVEENIDSQVDRQENVATIPSYHLQELSEAFIPSPFTSDTQHGSLVIIPVGASSPSSLSSRVSASPSTLSSRVSASPSTLPSSNSAPLSILTASSTGSSTALHFDVQQARHMVTSSPISPEVSISTSSGISSISQPRSKRKRVDSSGDDYAIAIHELAESVKQPITINTVPNIANSSVTTTFDPVNRFGQFIESLLRTFNDEELKLQVMSDVSQMIINAKSADFQRAKKS